MFLGDEVELKESVKLKCQLSRCIIEVQYHLVCEVCFG